MARKKTTKKTTFASLLRPNKIVITIKVNKEVIVNKTMDASDEYLARVKPFLSMMEAL